MTLGWLTHAATRAHGFVRQHPHGLASGVLVLLGGFAAAAFGIAPLAPDAADLPRRTVSEVVVPELIAPQLEALSGHDLELSRNEATRAGDTADSLLARLGVNDPEAAAFLRANAAARRLFDGRAGKMVQATAGRNGTLVQLTARYPALNPDQAGTHFTRLRMQRDGDGWSASTDTVPMEPQVRLASGTIRSSLFAASDDARIPDAVAVQIAEMFSADIDFHRELKRGDTFSVVYEALLADGEPVAWGQGAGRVLAAEFINNGRTHRALWYRDANGRGSYFGFDGQSKRRAFLASPMEFSRVTSGFAMRMHPIMNTWRQHNGVDYGAPKGTPVRSVGDGTVEFAGWQNGYGNVIQLRHGSERSTLYAHLSRVDVKKGQRVEQGQRIGLVGATGWATGPHLHFEVRVRGALQDPLRAAKTSEAIAVAPASRTEFDAMARAYQAQLDVAETITTAQGQGD